MNKYKEAKQQIELSLYGYSKLKGYMSPIGISDAQALKVISELVERATPKYKMVEEICIVSGTKYYICTKCMQGGIEDDDEYCKHCGQDLTAD